MTNHAQGHGVEQIGRYRAGGLEVGTKLPATQALLDSIDHLLVREEGASGL